MPYEFFSWKEGEDLLFDDTFVHYAQNSRENSRTVLFMDVPRHDMPAVLSAVNTVLVNYVIGKLPRIQSILSKSIVPTGLF